MNVTKINALLKGLTEAEISYTKNVIQLGINIRNYIKDSGISKADFIVKFGIKSSIYKAYTNGAYNYSISDVAKLTTALVEMEIEKAKAMGEEMVTFPKYEYQNK